jgi:hypothetical protein
MNLRVHVLHKKTKPENMQRSETGDPIVKAYLSSISFSLVILLTHESIMPKAVRQFLIRSNCCLIGTERNVWNSSDSVRRRVSNVR